jgi:hypothetical protein
MMLAHGRLDEMTSTKNNNDLEEELEALAELVPGLRTGKVGVEAVIQQQEPQQQEFDFDLFANMLPQREDHADSPPLEEGRMEHPDDEDDARKKETLDTDPQGGESDPIQRMGEYPEPKETVEESGEVPDAEPFTEEEDDDRDEEDDNSPFRLVRREGRKTRRGDGGSDFAYSGKLGPWLQTQRRMKKGTKGNKRLTDEREAQLQTLVDQGRRCVLL